MNLKDQIMNKVVKPAERVNYDMVQAEVVEYDELTNTATVQFQDPRGAGLMELTKVPVQLGSGGVHSSGPFAGDTVWVNFNNRNPLYPRIIALGDSNYRSRTRERYNHVRQGACLPDDGGEYEIEDIVPIASAWLNTDKDRSYDYYAGTNPEEELSKLVGSVGYYGSSEPGITHPQNGSTVKVDDEGNITIFTGLGEGIRISPTSHTVTLMAGKAVKVNTAKWIINCEDTVSVSSKGNMRFDSDGYIIMSAKDFIYEKKELTS